MLLTAVRSALATAARQLELAKENAALRERLDKLTPREREVFSHDIDGKLNKQIAADLGTGEHTVKVHRGRLMDKLGVQSVAELVRVAAQLGVSPAAR